MRVSRASPQIPTKQALNKLPFKDKVNIWMNDLRNKADHSKSTMACYDMCDLSVKPQWFQHIWKEAKIDCIFIIIPLQVSHYMLAL